MTSLRSHRVLTRMAPGTMNGQSRVASAPSFRPFSLATSAPSSSSVICYEELCNLSSISTAGGLSPYFEVSPEHDLLYRVYNSTASTRTLYVHSVATGSLLASYPNSFWLRFGEDGDQWWFSDESDPETYPYHAFALHKGDISGSSSVIWTYSEFNGLAGAPYVMDNELYIIIGGPFYTTRKLVKISASGTETTIHGPPTIHPLGWTYTDHILQTAPLVITESHRVFASYNGYFTSESSYTPERLISLETNGTLIDDYPVESVGTIKIWPKGDEKISIIANSDPWAAYDSTVYFDLLNNECFTGRNTGSPPYPSVYSKPRGQDSVFVRHHNSNGHIFKIIDG